MQIDDSSGESMSSINSHTCETPSCSSQRCHRTQKFLQLLDGLSIASRAVDYEEQISTTIAISCMVGAMLD